MKNIIKLIKQAGNKFYIVLGLVTFFVIFTLVSSKTKLTAAKKNAKYTIAYYK
jgi:hypothetical protein